MSLTKTGKSILRPAFDQSNCKKAGPALILIERHLINSNHYNSIATLKLAIKDVNSRSVQSRIVPGKGVLDRECDNN